VLAFLEIDNEIDKIKAGDTQAFRSFFVYFYPKLMSHACRFVDQDVAKDLVQDVFTLYWEQKQTINPSNITSFLYKCVQNKCLNYLKHETVVEGYEERIKLAEARIAYSNANLNNDNWERIVERDLKDVVESSLTKLPPRSAEAFRLCFFHDLPHKEVAKIMSISSRTVETHIRRAVGFLRTDLHDLMLLIAMFNTII
jgi:RNA polymerase sigma-70 factor (family 1)